MLTDLEKTDCSARVAYRCGPRSEPQATIVPLMLRVRNLSLSAFIRLPPFLRRHWHVVTLLYVVNFVVSSDESLRLNTSS